MLHGVELYQIVGEGTLGGALASPEMLKSTHPVSAYSVAAADPFITPEKPLLAPQQIFCRLFDKGPQLDPELLTKLGLAMEGEDATAKRDSSIPSGYTYLGQFIDHDITFDKAPLAASGSADPNTTENHRTPTLDLDSVYGGGPGLSPALYENDGLTLRVGLCSVSSDHQGNAIGTLSNDLPRLNRVAVIADKRNDENLAIAQLHLAFIKFHNKIARALRQQFPSLPTKTLFERARRSVVLHYQRIVLRDFLPRIIDVNAIEAVLSNGHRIFPASKHAFMPVEFSVAAFRLGHSMIRSVYEWNRAFNTKPDALAVPTLELLFEFTQFSGSTAVGDSPFFGLGDVLPSNWALDWRLMFDIDGHSPAGGLKRNLARKIDTHLAFALQKLPEFAGAGVADPALLSLASRNLLRGRLVELASGTQAADAILATGLQIHKLTEAELKGGPHGSLVEQAGFVDRPPLWYYILREAELQDGERLGAVGSAIIAETIVAQIRNSENSILADASINSIVDIPRFSMPEMLIMVDDISPV